MNTTFTINWSDLPPPKKYTVADIISNLPFRYMAWMEGSEWPLHMPFTDRMSDTAPRTTTGNPDFASSRLNLGCSHIAGNTAQGPTEAHNV